MADWGREHRFRTVCFLISSLISRIGASAVVEIGRRQVVEALVVAAVVVVVDECRNLPFEVARQEVVLGKDAILQGLVPALDIALSLRIMRCCSPLCWSSSSSSW